MRNTSKGLLESYNNGRFILAEIRVYGAGNFEAGRWNFDWHLLRREKKGHSMGWEAWKTSQMMGKVRSMVISWEFKCMFETLHGAQLEGGQRQDKAGGPGQAEPSDLKQELGTLRWGWVGRELLHSGSCVQRKMGLEIDLEVI